MNILIVGNGAREHAIAWKLSQTSRADVKLFAVGPVTNPGIELLVEEVGLMDVLDVPAIAEFSQKHAIDIAFIGPEAPLGAGVVDALEGLGISCVGPTQELAQLETSKAFTRDIMKQYNIAGLPAYKTFQNMEGVADYIKGLHDAVVVKPDGLTGGKGVKVMGDHFQTGEEAAAYVQELFDAGAKQVVLEEKLVGQEFSLISFVDGEHAVHMPVVQDHKRVGEGDTGANTGGMGTYTMPDHSLPFITEDDVEQAKKINEHMLRALKDFSGQEYRGIMYGGFIAVRQNDNTGGVRVIEYNARFGDPEVMNLLTLLETDLVDIIEAITTRSLDELSVTFSAEASVCKYAVPNGYPEAPVKGEAIDVSQVDTKHVQLFFGSVDKTPQGLVETGSRTIALVAKAATLAEAEQLVEAQMQNIVGPVFHRKDIGTQPLIDARIAMMKEVRS